METEKKKRGRPPKHKAMEFEGMTYEGAINHALDQVVRADLDKCLANKDESQLTDDERKYLKRKREKKSYTLNVRFTESEMQDILAKCEQYGYKNKTEYIRDCVRVRVDLTPDRSEIAECNRLMKRIGANINQILVRLYSTGHIYAEDITEIKIKDGSNDISLSFINDHVPVFIFGITKELLSWYFPVTISHSFSNSPLNII